MTQSSEGRQVFGPLTVTDNLHRGAYMRRDKDIDSDRVFTMFPVSVRKTEPCRRKLVGRAAADAGNWSCLDGQAEGSGKELLSNPKVRAAYLGLD
jgi:hypothetical protein